MKRFSVGLSVLCVAGLAAGLSGCGQKGPLFLPKENGSVVTRPGEENSTQSPGSPSSNTQSPETAPQPSTRPADGQDPGQNSQTPR